MFNICIIMELIVVLYKWVFFVEIVLRWSTDTVNAHISLKVDRIPQYCSAGSAF